MTKDGLMTAKVKMNDGKTYYSVSKLQNSYSPYFHFADTSSSEKEINSLEDGWKEGGSASVSVYCAQPKYCDFSSAAPVPPKTEVLHPFLNL